MNATYIIQATRNGRQVPSFLLDANTLGIINAGQAARIALDVLVGDVNETTLRFLADDGDGNITATVRGIEPLGERTAVTGSVQYVIYAAPSDATFVTSEADFAQLAAGRLMALAQSSDGEVNRWVIEEAARLAVTRGLDTAEGYIRGMWYVQGNRRTDSFPNGANATWKRGLAAIGVEA